MIELPSCVDGARAVRFLVGVGPAVVAINSEGTSPNVIGTPDLQYLGPAVEVTAELDDVAIGDLVTMSFSATSLVYAVSIAATDVVFYTVPPDQIPPEPECSPSSSPEFALANDVAMGLVLSASNPTGQPMTLASLELAQSSELLPVSSLDWTNAEFNALTWHPTVVGGAPLDPAASPLVIDLPDEAVGANAALLRFASVFQGVQMRGIVEASLVEGTVTTTVTTWGAVKSLYRN